MRHSPIDPTLFTKNRMRLLERLPANTLSVVNANDLMPSNADGTLPYHPNSDLFYLSGIEQEVASWPEHVPYRARLPARQSQER